VADVVGGNSTRNRGSGVVAIKKEAVVAWQKHLRWAIMETEVVVARQKHWWWAVDQIGSSDGDKKTAVVAMTA
jgi:hypothetical protein